MRKAFQHLKFLPLTLTILLAVAAIVGAQTPNGIHGSFTGDIQLPSPFLFSINGHEGSTNKDVLGVCTLGTNCAVTFNKAYVVAPVCVGTDQTAAAAVKSAPTTTTVTFTGTGTDVIAYQCMGNPN